MTLEFSRQIFEKFSISIRPVGVELFHAEGRTDMTKVIVAFRNFANAPERLFASELVVIVNIYRYFEAPYVARHLLSLYVCQEYLNHLSHYKKSL